VYRHIAVSKTRVLRELAGEIPPGHPTLSTQAQAFHAEFVNLVNAGAGGRAPCTSSGAAITNDISISFDELNGDNLFVNGDNLLEACEATHIPDWQVIFRQIPRFCQEPSMGL
jgi:hypothetical protein